MKHLIEEDLVSNEVRTTVHPFTVRRKCKGLVVFLTFCCNIFNASCLIILNKIDHYKVR